jgi:class 3 adenylate cyclase
MAEGLKQKALYRELLGKVSDESVAQALVSGTLDLELGGELKEVTVLFCDIRGFTTMTEHMPPTDVIEMLNEHMTAMTEVVRSYYGVVDKFVGDEIMAVFGALKSYGDDSRRAAECALGMIQKRIELNQKRGVKINIGIGVATGEAVAGCMGSNDRLNYTVLGARVNLASRLCSAAGLMEVVIDDKTFESVREDANAKLLQDLKLKGFANSVVAYQLHALSERAEVVEQIP